MRLYQINAPLETNAGASYAAALVKFEACMLTLAGGYSEFVARGNWRDDNGKDHPEPMQVYQFASKPETRTRLVGIAFDLFPDQAAIFTAELGEAMIVDRK